MSQPEIIQSVPALNDLRDKTRTGLDLMKAEIGLVKLSDTIDPAIKATIDQLAQSVNSKIDQYTKSLESNADQYIDFTKLYYQEALYRLANEYNALALAESDQTAKSIIKEDFAKKAKETAARMIAQIQSVAKENGGDIGTKALAQLHQEALNLSRILRDDSNPEIKTLFEYTFDQNPEPQETEAAIQTMKSVIIEHYSNGNPKTPKNILFFLLGELTERDRNILFAELKRDLPENFNTQKFLTEGNNVGALTLANMETFRGGKYSSEERQKLNETFVKARENIPNLADIKGNFGDKNIWDDINSKSIGLFFADILAGTSLALNAGFAIGGGNAMDIFSNDWNKLTGGWLLGRHIAKGEKTFRKVFESKTEKESYQHSQGRQSLLSFQQNTLAFEEWDGFINSANNGDRRTKALFEFATSLTPEGKDFPDEIAPITLVNFFQAKAQKDPAFKEDYADLKNISGPAADPKAITQLIYAIRYFKLPNQSIGEGITSYEHYTDALTIIEQEK